MRLSTEINARRLRIAGGAFLCIVGLSSGATAQTDQPKATQPPPTQAAPSKPAPSQPTPAQPAWVAVCANTKNGLDCRAGRSLRLDNRGQAVLNVAVQVPADTKKPVMLLQLPLGLYLPAGVSLQIGKDAPKTLPFQSCDTSGCLAEYPVTGAEIAAMLKGSDLTISAQTASKQPLTVNVSVAGFPAAYAKIK
jgi:invasion protein IalB